MKKIIAMILCLLMVFSCAAALGEEPVTIEVIQRKLVDANEDNIILREFEKRLGLKIDYTWKPAENYATQCAVVVASGVLTAGVQDVTSIPRRRSAAVSVIWRFFIFVTCSLP